MNSRAKLYFEQGWAYFYRARYSRALDFFQQALEIDPLDPDILGSAAIVMVAMDLFEQAASTAEAILVAHPESGLAYLARGMVRMNQKHYPEALQDMDRAIGLNPDLGYAAGRRAWTLHQMGRTEDALTALDERIAQHPLDFHAWQTKGHLLCELIRFDEAVRALSKAVNIKPILMLAYYRRGIAKEGLKDYDGALKDYESALQINPESGNALFRRAHCLHVYLDQTEKALQGYTSYLERCPHGSFLSMAYNNRGNIYKTQGQRDAALADFANAIAADKKNALPYGNRGALKLDLGDTKGATQDLLTAIVLNPKFVYAWTNLVKVWNKSENPLMTLSAQAHLYELEKLPEYTDPNTDNQFFHDQAFSHLQNILLPQMKANGERIVFYWEILMRWGAGTSPAIHPGISNAVNSVMYGVGYLVLGERNVWIVNLGDVTRRIIKTNGLLKRVFFAAFRYLDAVRTEKSDLVFQIPHATIRSFKATEGAIVFDDSMENWEIIPFWNEDRSQIMTALDLAEKDLVPGLWNPIPPPKKEIW